jgi:hypothetical protein
MIRSRTNYGWPELYFGKARLTHQAIDLLRHRVSPRASGEANLNRVSQAVPAWMRRVAIQRTKIGFLCREYSTGPK